MNRFYERFARPLRQTTVVFKQLDRLHSGDLTTMNLLSSSVPRLRKVSITVVASCLLLMAVWIFGVRSQAQSIQGSIIGTVVDKAGVVPGGDGHAYKSGRGFDSQGGYQQQRGVSIYRTKAGQYSVEVSMAGFERWTTTGVTLAARQQLRIDVSLTLGNVQQEVTVSADAIPPIDTDTASISAMYTAAEAANLPVNTRASASGTSALSIVGTLPGVQADHTRFSLQGGLPFQTEVSVDGITVQNATSNVPIADAFPFDRIHL